MDLSTLLLEIALFCAVAAVVFGFGFLLVRIWTKNPKKSEAAPQLELSFHTETWTVREDGGVDVEEGPSIPLGRVP